MTDTETIKARSRLRKLLMVNPNQVHLFTRQCCYVKAFYDERWLSDRYVMVNVTDDPVLQRSHICTHPDSPCVCPAGELPDGAYKLTAAHGLEPNDGWLVPATAGLLKLIESREGEWIELHRTQWSVSDSPAKLMVAYTKDPCGGVEPYAINEGIWAAFEAAFPDVEFWARGGDPYKVTSEGRCVGYVARGNFMDADVKAQAYIVAASIGAPVIPWKEVKGVA